MKKGLIDGWDLRDEMRSPEEDGSPRIWLHFFNIYSGRKWRLQATFSCGIHTDDVWLQKLFSLIKYEIKAKHFLKKIKSLKRRLLPWHPRWAACRVSCDSVALPRTFRLSESQLILCTGWQTQISAPSESVLFKKDLDPEPKAFWQVCRRKWAAAAWSNRYPVFVIPPHSTSSEQWQLKKATLVSVSICSSACEMCESMKNVRCRLCLHS